jgi:hypothetical protein
MRIVGAALDPRQAYASEWVGDRTGGSESTVSGNGAPIIGVFGNEDTEHVMALGLIYLQRPGQPAPAAAAPRNQPAPKAATRAPQPAPDPPQAAANAPPAEQPDAPPELIKERFIDKFIDHEHHFSMTIPDGWRRMFRSEFDSIRAVLRQRQLDGFIQYETGCRPNNSAAGTFPYILVQVHKIETAGLTYQEIQDKLDMGLDEPIKFAEGKFSDVLANLSVGKAVLDRGRNRFVLRLQSEVFGVGKVEGISTCHLGSEAIVAVHCYGKSETFAKLLPSFTDLNNSFFFDDGYDFVPAKPRDSGNSLASYLVFGGVTIVLSVAVLAFVGWNRLTHRSASVPKVPARLPPLALPVQSTGIREGPPPAPSAWPPALGTDLSPE